jgi:tRNA threonylcarbamoyladenosine biosynthesis protein TsaE
MGAGKTTFVRGAARALGVTSRVTSPTFVLAHRLEGDGVAVAHLDLHRLAGLDGEDPGFLEDHLTPDAIAFVEWPEAALADLDPARVVARVRLAHAGEDAREVVVERP